MLGNRGDGYWLLCTLVLVATPLAAQSPGWTRATPPVPIADELYYVGTEELSAYLLTSDAGHVLIDVPLFENVLRIQASIWALGLDLQDIRLQLTTHAHYDHVGGVAPMLDATGADLVASERDAPFLREGRSFGLPTYGFPSAEVDRTVGHLDRVRVGSIELTTHLTPGHTPGCTSWSGIVSIEDRPYTFLLLCSLTVSRAHRLVGDGATYAGQGRDYCQSLAYLEGLHPDIFLAPHASWMRLREKRARLEEGDAQAFVGDAEYRAYLAQSRERIETALRDEGLLGGCAELLG